MGWSARDGGVRHLSHARGGGCGARLAVHLWRSMKFFFLPGIKTIDHKMESGDSTVNNEKKDQTCTAKMDRELQQQFILVLFFPEVFVS